MSRILSVAALLLLVFGIALTHRKIGNEFAFTEHYDTSHWADLIHADGASEAYAQFKTTYATSSDTHEAIHFMGDELYHALGLQALSVCDDSFGYGCFHQVLMDALLEQGPHIIPDIERACGALAASSSACFHGTGHGLAEYYRSSLSSALHACDYFSSRWRQICAGGVFMEHMVPLMAGGSIVSFDSTHPYAPCDSSVPAVTLGKCFYSLPHAWFSQRAHSVDDIIDLCAKASEQYRTQCYQGIGVDMPGFVSYDQNSIFRICASITKVEGKRACFKESILTLKSLGKDASVLRMLAQE